MSNIPVTGEVSNSKLAAVFESRDAARAAADEMIAELSLLPLQVKLIGPGTADVDIKLQPEGGGIWQTIIVAHVRLGVAGAVLGLIAFAVMFAVGVPFVVSSPLAAGPVAVGFGALAGLLLGGLVSLRPDQDGYINATHEAIRQGHTTVVVHALSAGQRAFAASFLKIRGARVSESL